MEKGGEWPASPPHLCGWLLCDGNASRSPPLHVQQHRTDREVAAQRILLWRPAHAAPGDPVFLIVHLSWTRVRVCAWPCVHMGAHGCAGTEGCGGWFGAMVGQVRKEGE